MKMDKKEEIFAELRKNNVRITKQRRAIIDVLEGRHLTIQEIHQELKKRGFHNLGTVYNNIDFLQEHKIVTQIFINGKKHYDLTIDDTSHTADSHIHVTCRVNNKIIEINNSDLFDMIKNHPIFEGFEIEKLQVVVEGECKDHDGENCKNLDHCFLDNIEKQSDNQ
jgi:Fur family ferric uptake transcriptional regulator/Fur family peroxide stress response transcriptional regulator